MAIPLARVSDVERGMNDDGSAMNECVHDRTVDTGTATRLRERESVKYATSFLTITSLMNLAFGMTQRTTVVLLVTL